MPESSWERAARYARENARFRSFFDDAQRRLSEIDREYASKQSHSPPLHGATDYRRRPDGVWEMPK